MDNNIPTYLLAEICVKIISLFTFFALLRKSPYIVCLLLSIFGSVTQSYAQENEFGFSVGGALYVGDLNPAFSLKNVRWASGTFFRYNFSNRMAARAGINYGFIEAADSRIKNFPYLQHRNLSFKSQILELALS